MRPGRTSCSKAADKQIELPLGVAICAWCEPDGRRGLDAALVSHGICPRHFKELEMSLNPLALERAKALPRRSRRKFRNEGEGLLPLIF